LSKSQPPAIRYECDRPGELVHVDVKKIGRIRDGGGWKAHGRQTGKTWAQKKARIGYKYRHSTVDDHSRLAYSEVLPDEKGPSCGGFIGRAAAYFAALGIAFIERSSPTPPSALARATTSRQRSQDSRRSTRSFRPHCPWQNGMVERFNRTLATEWTYRQVFTSNAERALALAPGSSSTNSTTAHRPPRLPSISSLSLT